jgi:hypothetical protein
MLQSKNVSSNSAFDRIRKPLVKALGNHVGSADQHNPLALFFPPVPHPLYREFKDVNRIFAHEYRYPSSMSVVLDDSTIVCPISHTLMEPDLFRSLATIVWQWWQQEPDLWRKAIGERPVFIRIMYMYLSCSYCRC